MPGLDNLFAILAAAERDKRRDTLVTQRAGALAGQGLVGLGDTIAQNRARENQQSLQGVLQQFQQNQINQRQETELTDRAQGRAARSLEVARGRAMSREEGEKNRAAAMERTRLGAGGRQNGREIINLLKTANDPEQPAQVRAEANRQLRALGVSGGQPAVPDVKKLAVGLAEMAQAQSKLDTRGEPATPSGAQTITKKLMGGPLDKASAALDAAKGRLSRPAQRATTTPRDRITGTVVGPELVSGILKRTQQKDPAMFNVRGDVEPATEIGGFLKDHINGSIEDSLEAGLDPAAAINRAVEEFVKVMGDDERLRIDLPETISSRSTGLLDITAQPGVKTGRELISGIGMSLIDPLGIVSDPTTDFGETVGLQRVRKNSMFSEPFLRSYAAILMQQHLAGAR